MSIQLTSPRPPLVVSVRQTLSIHKGFMKSNHKSDSAFTLIELLVVIAIIAILIAFVGPAISSAIATAQKIQCANNMRSIGQGLLAYASEHSGELPSANTVEGCWVECDSTVTEQKIEGIKRGKLWPYIEDLDTYRCPGTYGFMKDYVRNYPMAGNFDQHNPHPMLGRWSKTSDVMRPATTLLLVEDFDWRGYNEGAWIMHLTSDWYSWIDYLPGNHRHGDNFLFCDGHVEYRHYEDPETLSVYDTRNFRLPDPDGKNPDMDWIGKRYKSKHFYNQDGSLKSEYEANPPWNQ